MSHFQAGFKLTHECPLVDFSDRHSGSTLSFWCNFRRDVLEVSHGDPARSPTLQKDIRQLAVSLGGRLIRRTSTKSATQIITSCYCMNRSHNITPIIDGHGCLELQPSVTKGGWEWYRVIAFAPGDLKSLFADLDGRCEVRVTSKRSIPDGLMREPTMVSVKDVFGRLSGKQAQALEFALERGYYRVPKETTTERMAAALKVPRTTFEEHLRKAESKVLTSVGPFLHLSSESSEKTSGEDEPDQT